MKQDDFLSGTCLYFDCRKKWTFRASNYECLKRRVRHAVLSRIALMNGCTPPLPVLAGVSEWLYREDEDYSDLLREKSFFPDSESSA